MSHFRLIARREFPEQKPTQIMTYSRLVIWEITNCALYTSHIATGSAICSWRSFTSNNRYFRKVRWEHACGTLGVRPTALYPSYCRPHCLAIVLPFFPEALLHLSFPSPPLPSHPISAPCATRDESREIRTPNLLIWSQTRYRCAIPPMKQRMRIASDTNTNTRPLWMAVKRKTKHKTRASENDTRKRTNDANEKLAAP